LSYGQIVVTRFYTEQYKAQFKTFRADFNFNSLNLLKIQ